jgi:hypothetical protein
LQHECDAEYRQCAHGSVFVARRCGGGALWTTARRRERDGVADVEEIGSVDKVPDYIKRVKAGEFRLMGFGHRVYKNYDPRARIIKKVAYEVFEVTGKIRCSTSRSSSNESRWKTSTSSNDGCIQTSTSTRASSIRRCVSRSTCFR